MTVRIGHASIDENGKAAGGRGGDQTGKEVVIRSWYAKGWNVLLRPTRPELAEKSALACEAACANPCIGYDQQGRNTLYQESKNVEFDLSAIANPCECDCSSLMHVCAMAGGANLTYGSNGLTTRTMVSAFLKSGDYEKLTDSCYLTSDRLLQRGDILVKEGSHTAMVLGSGDAVTPRPETAVYDTLALPRIVKGMQSEAVRAMQQLLMAKGYALPRYGADGEYGSETENALLCFQEDEGIRPDGTCGSATWNALLGLGGVG